VPSLHHGLTDRGWIERPTRPNRDYSRSIYARPLYLTTPVVRWATVVVIINLKISYCTLPPPPPTHTHTHRVFHLKWNLPRQHASAAVRNELVTKLNSVCMLVGGFQVMWDTLYKRILCVCIFCAWLISFSLMIIGGKIMYFTSYADIRHLLELLKEIMVWRGQRKGRSSYGMKMWNKSFPFELQPAFPQIILIPSATKTCFVACA
jgi:hypothetical protein